MICQKCKSKPATTHIKSITNGKLTEFSLCHECANEMGYVAASSFWGLDNLLGSLLEKTVTPSSEVRCPKCNSSLHDITASGKVGCSECYTTFYDKLLPLVQRIHGTTVHKGKSPGRSALTVQQPKHELKLSEASVIEQKKLLLKNAIDEQRFEDAAKLRDEIKEIETNE